MAASNRIGVLGESSLHAALKAHYALPGDLLEAELDGCIFDILRGEEAIEIQTRNLANLRPKLERVLPLRRVMLVIPIPKLKWILREDAGGSVGARRRSPKQARAEDAFRELIRLPHLLAHPNLTLCLAFVEVEETWRDDGRGSWRRKGWSIAGRRLVQVLGERRFQSLADYAALLPPHLSDPFTNAQLAAALRVPPSLASKMSWTLARAGALAPAGLLGRAHLFRRAV
jgi:hypothetical protein